MRMTDIPPPPSGLEYLLNTHVMVSNNVEPWLEEYQTTLYRHELDDTEVYDRIGEALEKVQSGWWETHTLNDAIGGNGISGKTAVGLMVNDMITLIGRLSKDAVPFEKMRLIRMLDALSWYDHLDGVKDIRISEIKRMADDIPATVMDGDVADMVDTANQMDKSMTMRGDH
jgi:hypothetical protein